MKAISRASALSRSNKLAQFRQLSSVPQRLAALTKLQEAADTLAGEAEKELLEKELEVRAALHKRAEAIRARRAEIIAAVSMH